MVREFERDIAKTLLKTFHRVALVRKSLEFIVERLDQHIEDFEKLPKKERLRKAEAARSQWGPF